MCRQVSRTVNFGGAGAPSRHLADTRVAQSRAAWLRRRLIAVTLAVAASNSRRNGHILALSRRVLRKLQIRLTRIRADSGPWNRSSEGWISNVSDNSLRRLQKETSVLPTQQELEALATRIELAYRLRQPRWVSGCSTARVWFAGANRLWEAHQSDPQRIPLDPELFVACQPVQKRLADPWSELAQPESGQRYRLRVRHIIRLLKAELEREVRRAERAIRKDGGIRSMIAVKNRGVSPLGLYIVALRAARADVAESLRAAAALQHRSCPLYRAASLGLFPADCQFADELDEVQSEMGLRPAGGTICVHEKYKVVAN